MNILTNSQNNAHRNIPDNYGHNAYLTDQEFTHLLRIYTPESLFAQVEPHFKRLGELAGGVLETLALSADKNPPTLHQRTRNGADAERIEKHPSYVVMEQCAFSEFGLAAMSHREGVFDIDHVLPPIIKYGLTFLFVQAEFGLCCPLSMTDALTRTLVKFGSQELIDRYFPNLTTQTFSQLTQGAMFITEQDAGSDIGAITTEAHLENGEWRLYGDKWFCSNVDADLSMVLARPVGAPSGTAGLSLFLLPRILPDGTRNAYRVIRLKDKLGTRSMASGEILLDGATAYLVGKPEDGFRQMTDMINMSRLSNGVRSAGLMRRAVNESLFLAHNRIAFGKQLVELPLMQRQLIKMLVTAEQGRTMVLHTACILERADANDAQAQKLMRILTPLIKFRTCRDARKVAGDAMEVRGGCGYIEEWSDARVLRDAHLGSIWEGTSNIVALDVARACRREGALEILVQYLTRLLNESTLPARSHTALSSILLRAADMMKTAATERTHDADIRRAASALYHATSAALMAWEAGRIHITDPDANWNRLALAHLVLQHKLLPADPLTFCETDTAMQTSLLNGTKLSLGQAMTSLPA